MCFVFSVRPWCLTTLSLEDTTSTQRLNSPLSILFTIKDSRSIVKYFSWQTHNQILRRFLRTRALDGIGAMSAQKALQWSDTKTRKLLEGTKETKKLLDEWIIFFTKSKLDRFELVATPGKGQGRKSTGRKLATQQILPLLSC